jgi:hypothetical protein
MRLGKHGSNRWLIKFALQGSGPYRNGPPELQFRSASRSWWSYLGGVAEFGVVVDGGAVSVGGIGEVSDGGGGTVLGELMLFGSSKVEPGVVLPGLVFCCGFPFTPDGELLVVPLPGIVLPPVGELPGCCVEGWDPGCVPV